MSDGDEAALVGLIYQAALSPHLWQTVFDETCQLLGLHGVGAIETRLKAGPPPAVSLRALSGVPTATFASYRDYYIDRDPNLAYARHQAVGTVYGEPLGLNREAFRRSEIFTDFIRPNGADCPIVAILERNGPEVTTLLAYPQFGRQFTAEQVATLQHIVPHLCRSLQIETALAQGRLAQAIAAAAINETDKPLFVVDRTGRVLQCNALALALLDEHRPLLGLTAQGRLAIRDRDGQRRLNRAIEQALHAADGAPPPSIFQLDAEDATITVLASPSWSPHPDGPPLVSVLMKVAGRPAAPAPALLQQEFSLTPAEARIVADLVQGLSVEEIAEKHRLKRDTVYTHVKHAREKAGASSQAQLVAMVLGGLAAFRGRK